MQAQAAGGSSEGIQGLLQNPKVQIGVIAVGAIAIIVVIWLLFFNSGAAPAPTPAVPGGPMVPEGAAGPPGGPVVPGGVEGAPGAPGMPPGASGMPVGAPMGGVSAAPGGMAGPGGAPGAAAEGATKKKAAGVPTRKNPFAETKEIDDVLKSIPEPPVPEFTAQAHNIYVDELHKPKPPVGEVLAEDETDGPPIPTMRVAGVVYGKQVSATLQIGEQYIQVTPGQMVPASNPLYRVDRIEQEKVFLSRRWETGSGPTSKKGVQRIEVGLSARAASPGGAGYGAPGGYPGGYPGGGVPTF